MNRTAWLVVLIGVALNWHSSTHDIDAQSVAPAIPPCEATVPPVVMARALQAPTNLRIVGNAETVPHRLAAFVPASHDYYVKLASRRDCLAAYSLRDPQQLATRANGGYSARNVMPPAVTYDPQNDPDPRRQDAAKIVISPSGNNLTNQVRLPIPTHGPDDLFVVWDVWFGAEWLYDVHGIREQKTWQFSSPRNVIHTEVRMRYRMATLQAPGQIAIIDGRQYSHRDSVGPNVKAWGTLEPRAGTFAVKPETWTRLFAYFKAPASGEWWEYSVWAADAETGPALIYDRLQVKPSPKSETASWEEFWLEYNTSTPLSESNRPDRPPLVAYARNVVMLKGIDDVTPLLQRP